MTKMTEPTMKLNPTEFCHFCHRIGEDGNTHAVVATHPELTVAESMSNQCHERRRPIDNGTL